MEDLYDKTMSKQRKSVAQEARVGNCVTVQSCGCVACGSIAARLYSCVSV